MDEKPNTWTLVKEGLDDIYNKTKKIEIHRYMSLYSLVYSSCTQMSSEPTSGDRKSTPGAEFVGGKLYDDLKDYIMDYVKVLRCNVENLRGLELLDKYNKLWTDFQFSSTVVQGIFSYLNRHWIKREMDEGKQDVYEVYNLAIHCWERELFFSINQNLTTAVLKLIEDERKGESISTSLITGTISSYLELGINGTQKKPIDKPVKTLEFYEKYFLHSFIEETKRYYKEESQQFLLEHTVVEYIRKVDNRLKEERLRVQRYLDSSTSEPLLKALDETLICEYIDRFRGEFNNLVEKEAISDLAIMFFVCSRVDGALDALKSNFEAFVSHKGYTAIQNCTDALNDPKAYISIILDIHKRYSSMVSDAFKNENRFVKALDQACTQFINNNSVCQNGKQSHRSPELLVKYCDLLLRKSSKNPPENEMEDALNQVMIVFKYIEDKDVFQKFYSRTLAKRLVYEMSSSEDNEMSLLQKLKHMCGFEYTNRLQRMFTDTTMSKELTQTFKKHMELCKKGKTADMSVMVLAEGVWPFQPTDTFNVPPILAESMDNFKNFYTGRHTGRKLTYLYNLSKGEVVCNYPPGKRYTFVSTLAQMTVLLLFNDSDDYAISSIIQAVGMKKEQVLSIIQGLLKIEILKLEEGSFDPDMSIETKVIINPEFTSRKIKIDISKGTVNRGDTKKESESLQKDLEEDRKMVIQAAIVRVMKMRKQCKHQPLVAEVIKLLAVRFNPNVKVIKKCIDVLIEKEYMRRSETERDLYEYIS